MHKTVSEALGFLLFTFIKETQLYHSKVVCLKIIFASTRTDCDLVFVLMVTGVVLTFCCAVNFLRFLMWSITVFLCGLLWTVSPVTSDCIVYEPIYPGWEEASLNNWTNHTFWLDFFFSFFSPCVSFFGKLNILCSLCSGSLIWVRLNFFFLICSNKFVHWVRTLFCTSDRQRAKALGDECWNKIKWV